MGRNQKENTNHTIATQNGAITLGFLAVARIRRWRGFGAFIVPTKLYLSAFCESYTLTSPIELKVDSCLRMLPQYDSGW